MKFSEFVRLKGIYISTHNRDTDVNENYNIDNLLQEYNDHLKEEQNKSITSDFLLGLGFEKVKNQTDVFISKNDTYQRLKIYLNIGLIDIVCYDIDDYSIPFPKTQKDVLDLMRLLELN